MKTITLLAIFLAFSLIANVSAFDCDHMARATTSDQKGMAFDIANKFLGLKDEDILKLKVSQYVSWKTVQILCLADIAHYAVVEVEQKDGSDRRCTTKLELHTKDFFVAQVDFNREYKPRNVETKCFDEDARQREARGQCDAMVQCPRNQDAKLYRDIYDNCKCKLITDMVQYDDVQGLYEDFYNPNKPFSRPEGLESPFN